MKKEILKVLNYFLFFDYPPTFEEIYTFLPIQTTKKRLNQELEHLIKQKKLLILNFELLTDKRYTVGEYGIKKSKIKNQKSKIIQQFTDFEERVRESGRKLSSWRFKLYIKLLSFFPQIKLVGLSGSISMMNAKKNDDIDLFIITAQNRLFTARFIAIILAQFLGLRRYRDFEARRRNFYAPVGPLFPLKAEKTSQVAKNLASSPHKDKICLNIFFDEIDLVVPKFKQSEYVAHEVLQMKPIVNKEQIYERFLYANRWVKKFFPNIFINTKIKSKVKSQKSKLKLKIKNLGDRLEKLLKKIQLKLINKHKTTEIITDTQLWFHPDDFEKKIKF
ncbi:MAG: hypothetical protein KatS3mg092_0684 [Patescibacteria group bacterium]|nr:MAG: hypothetical protein KatS3mg092_0684 [Patescibacteria group bacterium]